MKSFAVTVAALCSVASAFPFSLTPWAVQTPPPAGTQLYQLQSKSSVTAVNNQWVSLKTGSTAYGLASTQAAATKFFVNLYKPTGTYSFHNADDTRQVALQGKDSVLLNVIDVTNPNTDIIPGGTLMEWATFTMDGNVLGVKDGSTLTNRTFVAIQATGGYNLAFYDGASNTTTAVNPITLSIVKTT
ncbi:hypothetical protein K505DRAFT_405544 [Melanomma pulvis-pyrius CBS 109.77]|uniref:Ubiquitin 3 binding protein But2 C-terminal domain-containing protein n=1 Tax=Melanomma pulvis-pyrius CBS 109.77 TaxID=1314802 RepID=A0A6A6XPB7_9PLEO|nr:hypothetical protein K505DRAFT_405544 [Melanomma pulvis-pyrius CBS 109.77]